MTSQSLNITVDLEQHPWTDITHENTPLNAGGLSAGVTRIGLMPRGTTGGLSTVMMEVVLPDGTKVIAETTLRLFRSAASAILASPLAEAEKFA
jgi:hypothetical protein